MTNAAGRSMVGRKKARASPASAATAAHRAATTRPATAAPGDSRRARRTAKARTAVTARATKAAWRPATASPATNATVGAAATTSPTGPPRRSSVRSAAMRPADRSTGSGRPRLLRVLALGLRTRAAPVPPGPWVAGTVELTTTCSSGRSGRSGRGASLGPCHGLNQDLLIRPWTSAAARPPLVVRLGDRLLVPAPRWRTACVTCCYARGADRRGDRQVLVTGRWCALGTSTDRRPTTRTGEP